MLPPGYARLATNLTPTGSPMSATMGMVGMAAWAARVAGEPGVRRRSIFEADQLRGEVGQPFRLHLRPALLHKEVLALDPALLAQPLPEGGQ